MLLVSYHLEKFCLYLPDQLAKLFTIAHESMCIHTFSLHEKMDDVPLKALPIERLSLPYKTGFHFLITWASGDHIVNQVSRFFFFVSWSLQNTPPGQRCELREQEQCNSGE